MAEMHGFARWMVNVRTDGRARRVLRRLGPAFSIDPTARVLELGCGAGGLVARVHERFHPRAMTATDYDPEQIEAAREFLVHRWGSLPPSIGLQRVDALALPFPDASFDVVFAMMMLHHVEEHHGEYVRRPTALKEIRRVLAPAGRFVYSEMIQRASVRTTLEELGFAPVQVRSGWRVDLAVYRGP